VLLHCVVLLLHVVTIAPNRVCCIVFSRAATATCDKVTQEEQHQQLAPRGKNKTIKENTKIHSMKTNFSINE
jgi:hypothetical protein